MQPRFFAIALWAFLFGCPPAQAFAQGDSLNAVIAEQRTVIGSADSTGDGPAAFEARMHLADLVKPVEARMLLEQAAVLADSLGRPDLGAMAYRALARRYAASGQYAQAYAESLAADSLDHVRELREAVEAGEAFSLERQRLEAVMDSMVDAGGMRERAMARAIVDLQEKADRWMYVALAGLLLALLLVVWLLYRAGSTSTRLENTIGDLRKEIDDLKERSAKKPESPRTRERPSTSVDEAMMPVVEGAFRKAAPERLKTLREARERRDTEKILRVVASLRPQLIAFDADRFGPLIARLKAPDASTHVHQWSDDLDALEKGVEEWSGWNQGREGESRV